MAFFAHHAQQISALSLRNLQLNRTLAEQKRTEEMLQRQKALIASILESSSEAIFATDAAGTYLSINSAGARMLGCRPEEVIGRTDLDLLPAPTAREFRKTDEQVMASGQAYVRDEIGRIGGKPRTFLAHKTPWRDHAGQIAGVIGVSSDITERHRAEEELKRSENLLQKIFGTLPIGLWIADKDGKLLRGNPAGVKIWGADPRVPPSEYGVLRARRLPSGEAVAPDDGALSRTLREGVTIADERLEIEAFDGQKKIILNTTAPVLDERGKILGAIVVNQDITARSRAEEALRESERLYRSILDASPDDITITDLEGRIQIVSPSALKMFGCAREDQMVGRCALDFIDPGERERAAADIARLRQGLVTGPVGYRSEYRGLRADGSAFDVEVNGEYIRDGAGIPVRMILVVRDITDRKRAEERLRLQARLLNAVREAVSATDLDGRIQYWGRGAEKLFGYSAEEVMGRPYRSFAGAIDPPDEAAFRKEILARGSWHGEHLQRKKNGETFWTSTFIAVVEDERGQPVGYIGIDQDITGRRQAEAALRTSQQITEGIIDTIPMRVFWKDKDLRYLGCNSAFARDAGFAAPEDLVGKDDFQMGWRDQAESYRADDRQVIESGQPKLFIEEPQTTPGGKTLALLTSKIPLRNAQGEITGVLGTYMDITERKQAEEKLRLHQSYLSAIVENQPGLLWMKDRDGRFLSANVAFAKSCGLEAPALLAGKTDLDIWPRDLAVKYREDDVRIMESKQPCIVEEHISDRGERKWFETFKAPIVDKHGAVIGTTGYSRDISERRKAEELLRESESRFRNIAELLPDAVFEIDRNATICFANKRAFDLLGYSPAEVERGLNALDVVVPEEREIARERLLLRQAGKEIGAREYTAARKDGSTFPVILNMSPRMNGDELLGFLGAMTDITALKQAEEALQSSERRYRTFINATSDLVFLKDESFRYIITNRANSAFLGKPEGDVIGRTDFDLMPKGAAARCRDSDLAALKKGGSFASEETANDKVYQTVKFPVPLPGGRVGVGGFIRDITERKMVEESLRASEARHRDIAANIPGVVYQLQTNRVGSFDVPYMSAGCEALFEQPLTDLNYSALLFDHMHVGDRALFQHSIAKASKDMERWNLEFRILPAKNRVKWLRGSANPQRLPNGNVIWNGVMLDITELKLAEQMLREREAFQSLLMDTIPSPVYYKDRKGRYLGCNQAFEALFGQPKGELIGKDVAAISSPDLAALSRMKDAELLANPGTQVYESRLMDAKGNPHDVVFHKASIIDAQGAVAGLIGILLDITARKRAERTLQESEDRFKQVSESAEEWIWEMDAAGLYTYSSPVVEKILGYKPEELVGKKCFHELFAPEVREEIRKAAEGRTARKEPFRRLSNPVLHKDGRTVILETTGMPILDRDGNLLGYRGADTDITSRRRAEEQVARQLDELRRWQTVTLGREGRIAELKREVNALASRLGQPPPYESAGIP